MNQGEHLDALIMSLRDSLSLSLKSNVRMIKMSLGFKDLIAVFDPDAVKEVCVTRNLPKAPYASIRAFLGHESILLTDHDTHKTLRAAFNPGFSFSHLKGALPDICLKARAFGDKLDKLSHESVSGDVPVILMHQQLILLTIDIICLLCFSEDLNVMDEEHPPPLLPPLQQLIDLAGRYQKMPHLMFQLSTPWPLGIKGTVDGIKTKLDSILTEIVDRRRQEMDTGVKKDDILSLAITAAEESLSLPSILSQVKTFIFAGHDSSATTISFCLYELSVNKLLEDRVILEIRTHCSFDNTGRVESPSSGQLGKMIFLSAVIQEALRLWPPAGSARIADKGCRPILGYQVEGSVLYLPHYPLHRDEIYWGTDAGVFRPDRWLDEAYVSSLHPFCYTPFSKGPRDCIGQTLAILEAKAVLVILLSQFEFRYAGKEPEDRSYRVTGVPRYGMPMKVTKR